MFERISNSFAIAKSSIRVLSLDKELILFPILSGVSCLLVLASFATPFIMHPEWLDKQEEVAKNPIYWIVLFLFYVCNYFVIVYFNSALISCALLRFAGKNPTVGDGIRAANRRLPQIFAWALLSATVGVVLRVIESFSERVGQIVAGLIGAAWTICTYFVVPVLVVEKASPVEAFKRSLSILRKTWGESLVGGFGLGVFNFLLMLPGIAMIVGAGVAMNADQSGLAIALVAAGFAAILIGSAIAATLQGIFVAALYQFAAQDELPEAFDEEVLQHAFAIKGSN